MPLTPSPKLPLFIKAVKDMSSLNTFEKLLKLWSKLLTFRPYDTIVSGTTNYVSIWTIKAVSPLTAHIWVVFSIPRRPWCSNSQLSQSKQAARHLRVARLTWWRCSKTSSRWKHSSKTLLYSRCWYYLPKFYAVIMMLYRNWNCSEHSFKRMMLEG